MLRLVFVTYVRKMTKVDSSAVLKDILDTERRVLKRKCRFLRETVYITDSVLDQLVTREILTRHEANRIKVVDYFDLHLFGLF